MYTILKNGIGNAVVVLDVPSARAMWERRPRFGGDLAGEWVLVGTPWGLCPALPPAEWQARAVQADRDWR